ncbi:MAG: RtcB family protein [Planctomycetes bacterium]|nr:RtcB family protein [Planctomycetota bacterium]
MKQYRDPTGYVVEARGKGAFVIPKQRGMRTNGLIFSSDQMIEDVLRDGCTTQVANMAHLPGIVGDAMAMPDIHQGYGFPIGGVAAFDADKGVVSPGGVGYDINCGVRIYTSLLTRDDLAGKETALADAVCKAVPAGVGSKRKDMGDTSELLKAVLEDGAIAAVESGFGSSEDLDHIEAGGKISPADPKAVSPKAFTRGAPQLGTLGSGNHFVEVGYVDRILNPEIAQAFGLEMDGVTVAVHTGSRGFGHQICDDYLRVLARSEIMKKFEIPDRQLCCARIGSNEGQRYLAAMACAANYAFGNRQIIGYFVSQVFKRLFKKSGADHRIRLLYDLAHNIAKFEDHEVDGRSRRLLVHRKGATRAFPPGHSELTHPLYKKFGQPVFIPGDMGRYSFVLAGTHEGASRTFGSSAHGAGRRLSRHQAKKTTTYNAVLSDLKERGVEVRAATKGTMVEEMPHAYKDVADVMEVVVQAGLGAPVARIRPLVVVKG